MASRSGQSGYIERKGNAFHVRFRIDVPGQDKRIYQSIRLCPVSGPGSLNKAERKRKAREIVAASGADTVEHFEKVRAESRGENFRAQANRWLSRITNRKRKPTKPATIRNWRSMLNRWVLPEFGALHLADVNNLTMRKFVERLCSVNLSPKSINSITQIPKMVVASVVNENGEEVHPRKWNAEFIDMPVVTSQHQPVVSGDTVSKLVAQSESQYGMLFALLAGTGMRAGEVLALEVKHVSADFRTLTVEQSLWQNRIQSPKTVNGIREIDLHPDLAAMLETFKGDRTAGLLFRSRTGSPLSQTNTLRRHLHPQLRKIGSDMMGFHSFRRFRATHLRKQRCPEDLTRFWLGHANRSITDEYSKLADDVEFRLHVSESVGLGFRIGGLGADVAPKSLILHPNSH